MLYIDVMSIQHGTIRTLSADILNPVTGLNYARHHSMSVSSIPHRHTFMEVFLITDGAILHVVNGGEEFLEPGAARLIRADDAHSFKRIEDRPCELYNVAFSVPFYHAAQNALGTAERFDAMLKAETPAHLVVPSGELEQMARRLERARADLVSDPKTAAVWVKVLLVELLAAFAEAAGGVEAPRHSPMPEWMADACAAFKSGRLFLKGVPALLEMAGRSHEHVCREFGKILGMTPTDYVNDLRLNHAAALLAGSDDKIHAIAMDSGFDSLSHFHHLFKKKFNLSPARYRGSVRRSAIPE